jgi:multidrug efflux pump subunit AcrB
MRGPIAWFARNEVAANLLMVVILFLGGYALVARITLEVFPSFERDSVSVSVSYRGATPAEVEEAAIIRIEEAIADLEGVAEISSTAGEGSGSVSVEVEKGRNPRDLLDDIKNRVDAISSFPDEVERPTYRVSEFRRDVISVVIAAQLPERELRELTERVRDELVALPEVSLVELTGARNHEIAIEVSEATLDRHDLGLQNIVDAVQRSSIDLPAGTVKTRGGEILLRTKGQAYRGQDFARIPVISRADGTRVTLGELAEIRDGFEEEPLYAEFNGTPAMVVEVFRTGSQNALDIGRAVREYVQGSVAHMPPGVQLGYWRDRSRIVKLRLDTLVNNALQGGLLVFLCLALFLRLSVALWVCVGIPISFMGALALLPDLGITINLLSLFAFILVLGIVVDDAIVTGENIYTHLKSSESSLQAAIRGTQEVAVPVTFGLLTTVAAFVPLMYLGGYRGPIFAQIPYIVIPVLVFSWIESKLILPAHMRHVRVHRAGWFGRLQSRVADGLERAIVVFYRPVLEKALNYRYLTFALFLGLSFVLAAYVLSGRWGYTFFPRVETETARATLSMQTGTAEAVTTRHVRRMAEVARQLQDKYRDPDSGESVIRNILVTIGSTAGRATSRGSAELGQVSLELVPPEERRLDIGTKALVSEWRKAIGPIPGAKELNFRAEIGRHGDPIDVQLTGQDFEVLSHIAEQVRDRLREYDGVFDIQDSFEDGKPEIKLRILPEAELLGLSARDLGRQVRNAFFGAEAQRFQRSREDVRVMVRYPQEQRRSLAALDGMRIRTADGVEVPIRNVADIELGQGFTTIRRIDRQRTINVTADADKERVDTTRIGAELSAWLDELLLQYPGVRYSMEGELREQSDSYGSLLYSIGFVLFSIYALLAIPFRSYSQPVLVMLVIPFSMIGALLGHILLGLNLSFMSVLGMLALAGVVVNDSLVLVDWINRRRAEGMAIGDAVRSAGVARFRPILLTSITTFAGLGPLILEKSTQAQFLIPMAVSLGFGILYSTLLSLLLVPAGYLMLEDLKRLWRGPQPLSKAPTGESRAPDT